MHRFATHVDVPDGAIDTCGTGGDRSGTVNVSTMAALIAAGAGARVVKHGNRAASSQAGSADVLEELGVAIELGPQGVAKCVEEAGVGFCFARRYHPGNALPRPGPRRDRRADDVQLPRAARQPGARRRQAVGVCDATMAERMLGALRELGTERAMIFFGDDGLDELTTTTTSVVYELTDGRLHSYALDPQDFGIPRAEPSQLVGGDAATNAKLLRAVLRGDEGPHRNLALLNAAAALMVAGIAADFPAGIEAARASIDSGAADAALDTMARVSTAEAVTEAAATEKGA